MMKQSLKDRLALALLIFAVGFFAFGYGIAAGLWELPPAEHVRKLQKNITDIALHWQNDLGFRPTRTLVESYGPDRSRVEFPDPAAAAEGEILIAGLTPHRRTLNTVILSDRQGKELHVWPVDYDQLNPDGPGSLNTFFHGLAVFEDGSIIVNFDGGGVLAKIGACGNVLWKKMGKYHHAISKSHDGSIWTLRGNKKVTGPQIVQLDPDSGKILKVISLIDDVMKPQELQGIMAIRTSEHEHELIFRKDAFHINHVEALDPETARAFPMFESGDLLISLRSLNLVAVLDPESLMVKWQQVGPWYRQHNPHFLKDGTIMVYDNNMSFRKSRIMAVDPAAREVRILFEGNEETPFYSWRRGKAEQLSNGNLLIAESEKGRIFEVTPAGKLVWEYNNIYDEEWNGVVSNVIHVPPGFFNDDAFSCSTTQQTAS